MSVTKDNCSVLQKQNDYNDIVVLLCLSYVKQGMLYINFISQNQKDIDFGKQMCYNAFRDGDMI